VTTSCRKVPSLHGHGSMSLSSPSRGGGNCATPIKSWVMCVLLFLRCSYAHNRSSSLVLGLLNCVSRQTKENSDSPIRLLYFTDLSSRVWFRGMSFLRRKVTRKNTMSLFLFSYANVTLVLPALTPLLLHYRIYFGSSVDDLTSWPSYNPSLMRLYLTLEVFRTSAFYTSCLISLHSSKKVASIYSTYVYLCSF
jgi:hypothetical protein